MGLYLKQNETRSELRQRIEKELQEKARQRTKEVERPDGIEDTDFVRDTKSTTSLAWLWAGIFIAVIVLIIWLLVGTLQ